MTGRKLRPCPGHHHRARARHQPCPRHHLAVLCGHLTLAEDAHPSRSGGNSGAGLGQQGRGIKKMTKRTRILVGLTGPGRVSVKKDLGDAAGRILTAAAGGNHRK